MCRLPQQEPAEALLAAGPDHQVRVGLACRVKVLGDVLDVDVLSELLDRGALARVLDQQAAHRVRDLAPPAVTDGHVDNQAGIVDGRLGSVLQNMRGAIGQQVKRAHRVHVPALVDETVHRVLNDGEQRAELLVLAPEVVGRQQPEGHHLDACLPAPLNQLEDLVRALTVPLADVGVSRGPGPAPVAIENDPHVPRDLPLSRQVCLQPPLVKPVAQVPVSHEPTFLAGGRTELSHTFPVNEACPSDLHDEEEGGKVVCMPRYPTEGW